ncbi:NAD(P)-dependent oxidoreductase [Mucilaginibacter ginsenosidivorax]|uniref:NAD-dependent epimerase/dehydratase family protein n=1 Tax=Mucilaginibacter ginsenosidivorax TaxID=862126 RepID=A0A5B8W574_9SPHI|nr:NAD(P)H-binding protein [Mucilaginibacter ginsenosidivorax]QEC78903.1 NAD-dependent epimerase/dehydratase family protein [Mucilaginibacter ginsenosidivorax]
MKIAIIGISGNVGQRLSAEALNRGHQVTGIARNVDVVGVKGNLKLVNGNAADSVALSEILKGHDVVISSLKFETADPNKLIEAVRLSGVKRYLVVGGASSLNFKPGVTVLESGHVPDWAIGEAKAGVRFLDILHDVNDVQWTFLSPSALFTEGERTGKFRLGKDDLLIGENGKSSISYEDFAIALIDEVETPKHQQSRFTVGY